MSAIQAPMVLAIAMLWAVLIFRRRLLLHLIHLKVQPIKENNKVIGFALEQTFKSEQWPSPCNYNYLQRYEFYKDGRFGYLLPALDAVVAMMALTALFSE